MWREDLDADDVQARLDALAASDDDAVRERYVIKRQFRSIGALISLADLRRLEMIEDLFAELSKPRKAPHRRRDLDEESAALTDEDWEQFRADLREIREETRPVELAD